MGKCRQRNKLLDFSKIYPKFEKPLLHGEAISTQRRIFSFFPDSKGYFTLPVRQWYMQENIKTREAAFD